MRRPIRRGTAAALGLMVASMVGVVALFPVAIPEAGTAEMLSRACGLDKRVLIRVWRGYHPGRSEDLIFVPRAPNYIGTVNVNSHTGPWDYLQRVPLVLYGPKNIASRGVLNQPANLVDLYPTLGALLGVHLPVRDGSRLTEAVLAGAPVPKLVLVVVWDGAGRNVLDRWPGQWPNLERIESEGTSYARATVGSSPSITPASHASLGTGAWPRKHGITAIRVRAVGRVGGAFPGRDPSALELSTFADEMDTALSNEPRVGLVAWQGWHLGMLGRGSGFPSGDKDTVAIIGRRGRVVGNSAFFSTPGFLNDGPAGIERRAAGLDRSDGRTDGRWRDHPILESHANPAWVRYETGLVLELLRHDRYGVDEIPDLLFVNYKSTDVAGHEFTMDSKEMGAVLAAQDRGLGRILAYLDRKVRNFVVVVTADHGHTPSPATSGAWPIAMNELIADLNRDLGTGEGRSLVDDGHAVGLFLDRTQLRSAGIDVHDVASYLNGYTIAENWPETELPADYAGRGDEKVFSAVFPGTALAAILRCRFGSAAPPAVAEA